jgi:hypothetical protein
MRNIISNAPEQARKKIHLLMVSKCYNLIPKKVINGIIKNMEVLDLTYFPEYDKYIEVDFNKFDKFYKYDLTDNENILHQKITQIKEEMARFYKEKERENKYSFRVFDFDISSINKNLKMIYLIGVFAILIFTVLISLKKLEKKNKAKNNSKRN